MTTTIHFTYVSTSESGVHRNVGSITDSTSTSNSYVAFWIPAGVYCLIDSYAGGTSLGSPPSSSLWACPPSSCWTTPDPSPSTSCWVARPRPWRPAAASLSFIARLLEEVLLTLGAGDVRGRGLCQSACCIAYMFCAAWGYWAGPGRTKP